MIKQQFSSFLALVFFCLLCSSLLFGQKIKTVERALYLDKLFRRQSGWTGGDADYSVYLGHGRALWLFGDSWIGQVKAGKHVNAKMVNNAISLQSGLKADEATLKFCWQKGKEPKAFFLPSEHWFWPLHGIKTKQGLFVFLVTIGKTKDPSVFGFKTKGSVLAHIDNPQGEPEKWNINYHRLPFLRLSKRRELLFGASILRQGKWIYIYGTDDIKAYGQLKRAVIVARVQEHALLNFTKWRFWNGRSWKSSYLLARPLFFEGAKEFSVSYLPKFDSYVAIYTHQGMSKKIVARFASSPEGPFGKQELIYESPEMDLKKGVFTYAAKAHPWLSQNENELFVTYTSNCMDFFQLAQNANLYWPIFLRLSFD